MKTPFTIDPERLRALRALADHGTVTAAGRVLHLSPSAVSQQIAALSRSTGVPLLVRHGRRVRLTPQALVLLDHARLIEAQFERARTDLAAFDDGEVGVVTIASFGTAIAGLVAPAIGVLSQSRPRLVVTVMEVEAPECFERLDDGAVDVAVTVDFRCGPHRNDPRYERVDLMTDPLFAVLPVRHRLARRRHVQLNALADDAWVMGTAGHPCADITDAALASTGVFPHTCHRVNDWDAVIAIVAQGSGVALVPALALGPSRSEVVALPVKPWQPARGIYAAVRNGSALTPHIAAVTEALSNAAGDDLTGGMATGVLHSRPG